jgi:uncharacterized protein involved in exopolysaccharide biosynthesis/Mrp family chromosome partitioning ATPase
MNNAFQREVRSVLLPLWRWVFVIVLCIVAAIFGTKKWIGYMQPLYRSKAILQIDNRDNGIDGVQNFSENAVPLKSASTGFTEIEHLKSRLLVGVALDSLKWNIEYNRIGDLITTELYKETPFFIQLEGSDSLISSISIELEFLGDSSFMCTTFGKYQEKPKLVTFGHPFMLSGKRTILSKNKPLLAQKYSALRKGDRFEVHVKTRTQTIDDVLKNELFIKALDKENTLLQITYTHSVPEKSRDFLNGLLKAYMENSVALKKRQATETITFLDRKLDEAAEKVNEAAAETAKFRTTSNIADSKLELNMAFNERMQYNVHDVNYDLQRVEIKRIYDYLKSGKGLQEFAPNFEAFNDPVFRDAFLKMQALELQKQDLLVQYTPKSKEVITIQDKINQLSTFLNESISNALGSLKDKQDQLKKTISHTNAKISALPDKQYKEAYHARNLQLNEEVYSQLVTKKASLSLAASSIACYHHIVEAPDLPRGPFSPNKALLMGLGVLCALGFGIMLAYLLERYFSKARNEVDLEALQLFPVLGRVNRLSPKLGFSPSIMNNVLSELTFLLKKNEEKQAFQIITFCSAEANTGKSFLCEHVARVFAQAGKRVLLVDTHIQKNDVAKRFEVHTNHGITEMIFHGIDPTRIVQGSGVTNLDLITAGLYYEAYTAPAISNALDRIIMEMAPRYDILLIDTAPMLLKNDAFPILLGSHINLFVTRYKRTRLRWVKKISNALIDRKISSVYYVLNDAPIK